jgi:hypothetical protein
MLYQPPFGSSDPDAPYVDRSTSGATRGSIPPAGAIEFPQREIVDVLSKSGLTPATGLQLSKAIRSQAMNYFTAGGTADALTITPIPAFVSLAELVGVPLRIISASANSGAMTLNANGLGAVAVTRRGGATVASGDWPSGVINTVIYDGTAFRLQSATPGEISAAVAVAINDAHVFAGNGYQRLPSGLILQWGNVTFSPTGTASPGTTVTLPTTYPNAIWQVYASNKDAQGTYVDNAYGYAVSTSQIFLACKASDGTNITGYPMSWLTIGY